MEGQPQGTKRSQRCFTVDATMTVVPGRGNDCMGVRGAKRRLRGC